MKVMYILHSCIAGGATISFLNLVKGIREKNIEVVIVHPRPNVKDESLIKTLTNIGCKCVTARIATSINPKRKGVLNFIKFILRFLLIFIRKNISFNDLKKIVKSEKPDIIHTNTGVVHEGYLVAKKYNIPHVWHLREYQEKDFNWIILPSKLYFEKMLRDSYSICITKDIQKFFDLNKYYKSFVIYNPIMSLKDTEKELLYSNCFIVANRLSPEKGIEDILDAYSIFCNHNQGYKLMLLGFGDEKYIGKLKSICKDKSIESNVEFLGYKENVLDYIKRAKALIVGSFYEGFGRMTAEANMLGVPVIGRNTGGTKEILELTKGGFLFDTVEQMADYMREIAAKKDSELSKIMKKPHMVAEEHFSNEQHIQKVKDLYNTILSKKAIKENI